MVMDFKMGLDPTSVIIFSVVAFHCAKALLLLILSHLERVALAGPFSDIRYGWTFYTKEDFKACKATAETAITYNIYYEFYDAGIVVAVVIFEAFHAIWQLSEMLATKYQITKESVISLMYLLMLRTLFLVIYFPVDILKLRVTQQAFGGFLLSFLGFYILDLFLIFIFTIPAFYLIRYFNRNIIFLISAVYFVWILTRAAINLDLFLTLEPLEDGSLKKILEKKILPEIGFSIDDIYHSNDEVNEKVYLHNTWTRKTLVITGPLPVDKNISLIGDTHGSVPYTTTEVIALIVFKIGESSKGYIFSTILSTVVHLFTLMLICSHLYKKQYILRMAGFRRKKPAIANLLVVWYFVIQPYWAFIYHNWKYIYDFTQLTEAQFMVSHFSLKIELVSALVKMYHSSHEYPYHDYWYAIFSRYKRPLHSLVISILPPDLY